MRFITLFILLSFLTPCFSADFSYDSADTATLIAGGPAKAARVKSMFDAIKDYMNAVGGAWVNVDRIVDDTITGTKLADAVPGSGLEKDGSENLQVSLSSTSGLELYLSTLRIAVDDTTLELSAVSDEIQIKDSGVDTDQIADSGVTTAKINNTAVTADKIATDAVTTAKILDANVTEDKLATGAVVNAKITDGTIAIEKLETSLQGGIVPIGTVIAFAASSTPTGYIVCDGSAISRTTYSDLFDIIGITWGAGDTSTTFNVPDFENTMLIGAGLAYVVGDAAGVPNGAGPATPYKAINWVIKY